MSTETDKIEEVAKRNGRWALANAVISLFLVIMTGWMAWITTNILELRDFAARGDRFTHMDGVALKEAVRSEIKALEIPPRWFLQMVQRQQEELRDIDRRLDAHDKEHAKR